MSINYPQYNLRHSGYLGYISRCSSNLCRKDASWTVRRGFKSGSCQKTVSFQSDNYPSYYLRHQNGRVRISRQSSSALYSYDASWVYHEVSCRTNFLYVGSRNNYCVRPRPQVSEPLKLNKCYRFESVNFKGQHMRHRNYQLWKDAGNGELYWKDSTFKVVPALNGKQHQVSFMSINYPQYNLRHSGYLGYISRCRSNLCRRDASWTVRRGFKSGSCQKTVSFESDNYPSYYLRHQNGRVRISRQSSSTLYRYDASWVYHEVSCSTNFLYVGSRNGNCLRG